MIYRIFILSAIVAAVSAIQMLGGDRCTWGPSYWCNSLENARKCGSGSEEHCRKKVWVGSHPLAGLTKPIPEDSQIAGLTKPIPEDSQISPLVKIVFARFTSHKVGGNCALCELVVKEIFSKLNNNATEDELVEALEGLCEYMPTSSEVDSCKSFVEEYGKKFWEAFIDNVNTHDLCALLGLCSDEFLSILERSENNLVAAYVSKDIDGVGCDTCTAVSALVQKEVLANEKAIEGLLDYICTKLPIPVDDQEECDATVNTMFEELVSLFESYKPVELCQMAGMCPSFDTFMAPGPVALGQLGQTGVASPSPKTGVATASPSPKFGVDNSCENGPAFWCATEENIKLCKAEEYCEKQKATIVF